MSYIQLIILTIVAWGLGSFFYKIANNNMDPILILGLVTVVYIFLVPLEFFLFKVDYNYWNYKGIIAAALGAMAMCAGSLAYHFALQKSGVGQVTVSVSIYPAVTLFLSVFFLREDISLKKALGFALAFTGVYILSKK